MPPVVLYKNYKNQQLFYQQKKHQHNIHNLNSDNDPQPFQSFNSLSKKYKILKTIGEGSFGMVKLAIHLPTMEKVAIKVIEKGKVRADWEVQMIKKEKFVLEKS